MLLSPGEGAYANASGIVNAQASVIVFGWPYHWLETYTRHGARYFIFRSTGAVSCGVAVLLAVFAGCSLWVVRGKRGQEYFRTKPPEVE